MHIDFDLNIRACDIVGATCENCKKEKRAEKLRKMQVEIHCHHFAEVILCTKCLTSTTVRLRK